jgi:hypothetical protein
MPRPHFSLPDTGVNKRAASTDTNKQNLTKTAKFGRPAALFGKKFTRDQLVNSSDLRSSGILRRVEW